MTEARPLTIDPARYDPRYVSIVDDLETKQPQVVALREDLCAFTLDNGGSEKGASTAFGIIFDSMRPQGIGRLDASRDYFAIGKVLETQRTNIRYPLRSPGLLLESFGAVLQLIDQHEAGNPTRLRNIGPKSSELLRKFAGAVIL